MRIWKGAFYGATTATAATGRLILKALGIGIMVATSGLEAITEQQHKTNNTNGR